jgi:hypothetical protein
LTDRCCLGECFISSANLVLDDVLLVILGGR